jgi:UDP-glucose 4-epimerase
MSSTASIYVVSGGAGFIGSHLVDALLADPRTAEVRIVDNFSSGRREHLVQHRDDRRLKIHEEDLLNLTRILPVFPGADCVYHLAANPDARWGIENTRLDLEQETIATYNVLEAMRLNQCKRILLSSSGTVYGDIGTEPALETRGPALPISLYGAGKVASEALISAFCGTFGFSGMILRFGNIVGQRTTHGVIFDFIRKLAADSSILPVLGDGLQAKPYVYVLDLVAALRFAEQLLLSLPPARCEPFNVAPHDATTVKHIAETLLSCLGLLGETGIRYGDTPHGWPGDVAQSRMDATRLEHAGFRLPRTSNEAVETAIRAILGWLRTRPAAEDGFKLPPSVRSFDAAS